MTQRCARLFLVAFAVEAGLAQRVISTFAGTDWVFPRGNLAALEAPFGNLSGIATDSDSNTYLSDSDNNMVFRYGRDGRVTILAGNGIRSFSGDGGDARSASLSEPVGLAIDREGSVYVVDSGNRRIRKSSRDGIIRTIAGTGANGSGGDGGPALQAQFMAPSHIAIDGGGNLYVTDRFANCTRRIGSTGVIQTFAGTGENRSSGDGGAALAAAVQNPYGITVDSPGLKRSVRCKACSKNGLADAATVKKVVPIGNDPIDFARSMFSAVDGMPVTVSAASGKLRVGGEGKGGKEAGLRGHEHDRSGKFRQTNSSCVVVLTSILKAHGNRLSEFSFCRA